MLLNGALNKQMIFKYSVTMLLCVSLCACAKPYVGPIPDQIPTLNIPKDPEEPVKNLTKDSKPDEVIKAWVATATAYKNWNRTIRNQIQNSGL